MKRLLLLVGGLLGAAVVLAAPASAHAILVGSDPADGARLSSAPHTVTLAFDESVGLAGIGYVHVIDEAGHRVDARAAYHPRGDSTEVAVDLRGGLGGGTYTASFRVISDDSHPVVGSIAFVVGNGPLLPSRAGNGAAADPVVGDAFDLARWISYTGLALLGGTWLLLTVWPAGRGDHRARRIVWAGWTATGVGALAELLLQGPYTAGAGPAQTGSRSLLDDTLHTDYGQLHILRLLLLSALAVVLARELRPDARPSRADALGAALGLAIVWTFSRGGHGATTPPTWLSISVDVLHVVAMATWLGGLIMLVGALLPRGRSDELQAVLPTFSRVAFGSIAVLVVTGAYSAWRGIGTVHAVFATSYGLLVVGKAVLLAGILAVAHNARRAVHGRVVAYAMTGPALTRDPDGAQLARDTELLRRAVWVEAVVGLVVLALTAVLVAEPRGKEALHTRRPEPLSQSYQPQPRSRS